MKPFDIELAKAGHPVCLEDGTKVRVICTDVEGYRPVAATHVVMGESVVLLYLLDGTRFTADRRGSLFMAPRKEKRWIVTWPGAQTCIEIYYAHQHAIDAVRSPSRRGAEIHPIEVTLQ